MKQVTPQGQLQEGKGGELTEQQQKMQDEAYSQMLEELKSDRDLLVERFDRDKDLKGKILIEGIK